MIDTALDRLIRTERLRRDFEAYTCHPQSPAELAVGDLGVTLNLEDDEVDYDEATSRLGIDEEMVENALEAVSLVLPAASTFLAAATLQPAALRSLDALHLATALQLGDDLEGL